MYGENLTWAFQFCDMDLSEDQVAQAMQIAASLIAPTGGYVATSDPGTANLVAHYRFDGDAQDSSSNANNGTLVGNPTWTSAGKVGGALKFDGSDYVECGDGPSLHFTDAVTMSAWVKLAGPTPAQYIAGNQDGMGGGYKMGVFSDKIEFEIRTVENWAVLNRGVAGGTVLKSDEWYHVAGVYSKGGYVVTYVNGVLDRVLTTSAVLSSTTGTFKIACEPACRGYLWNGIIDDLRVYSGALSPAEIGYLADETPADGRLDVPPQQ